MKTEVQRNQGPSTPVASTSQREQLSVMTETMAAKVMKDGEFQNPTKLQQYLEA